MEPPSRKTLIFLYALSHIDRMTSFCKGTKSPYLIVAFNVWIEEELQRRGINFQSISDFYPETKDLNQFIEVPISIVREWYCLPEMKFFGHKGIRFGEVFEPMLEDYLKTFFSHLYLVEKIIAAHPEITKIVVPAEIKKVPPTAGPLAFFDTLSVIDAVRAVTQSRGLEFNVLGELPQRPPRSLYPVPKWKFLALALYNAFIGLAPQRPLKIFASEWWRNIGPFVERMDDVELTLMDRREIKKIPPRHLWNHRIRFKHPLDAMNNRLIEAARARRARFQKKWLEAKAAVSRLPAFRSLGVNWWKAVEPAFNYLIEEYSGRVIADIEVFEKILTEGKFNRVLLRASVGARQHHFFLLARIAHRLGILSIELQHGGANIDPRTAHSRLMTDYLAAYGTYQRKFYQRNGYAPERIIPVGSPRFDAHVTRVDKERLRGKKIMRDLGLDPTQKTLFIAVPEEGVKVGSFDSYTLKTLFDNVRETQKQIPGLQVVFKFRPRNLTVYHRLYLQKLFRDGMVCTDDNLFPLICASDAGVCGPSTVIYEIILGGLPLVLYPWSPFDTYHAEVYEPSAPIAWSGKEFTDLIVRIFNDPGFKETLIKRGRDFLKGYSFDGQSSARVVELLRQIR